jgi:hypothetical protein
VALELQVKETPAVMVLTILIVLKLAVVAAVVLVLQDLLEVTRLVVQAVVTVV